MPAKGTKLWCNAAPSASGNDAIVAKNLMTTRAPVCRGHCPVKMAGSGFTGCSDRRGGKCRVYFRDRYCYLCGLDPEFYLSKPQNLTGTKSPLLNLLTINKCSVRRAEVPDGHLIAGKHHLAMVG